MKSLKHKKARTFENIHPIILKKSRECYSDILQKHFHNTFSNKEFLDELKLADVTSIYTKVHPNKSIIYHPIGVLLVVSQPFEKNMHDQMSQYVNNSRRTHHIHHN